MRACSANDVRTLGTRCFIVYCAYIRRGLINESRTYYTHMYTKSNMIEHQRWVNRPFIVHGNIILNARLVRCRCSQETYLSNCFYVVSFGFGLAKTGSRQQANVHKCCNSYACTRSRSDDCEKDQPPDICSKCSCSILFFRRISLLALWMKQDFTFRCWEYMYK